MGHAQFARYALLLGVHGLQPPQMGHGAHHDEAQQEQPEQMKQAVTKGCPLLVVIKLCRHLGQFAQRHVGGQHGHLLPCGIAHWQRITAHQKEGVTALVRLTPVAVALKGTGVPGALGVVDVEPLLHQSHGLVAAHVVAIFIEVKPEKPLAARCILSRLLRFNCSPTNSPVGSLPRHETNRHPHNLGLAERQLPQHLPQRIDVNLVGLALNLGQGSGHGRLHLLLDAGDAVALVQVALCLHGELLVETATRRNEVHDGIQFQQHGGHDDDQGAHAGMVVQFHRRHSVSDSFD